MPLVARYADWWNCPGYAVADLSELRRLAGRARISVQHPVGLAPSSAAAEETAAVARRRFGRWGALITGTAEDVGAALAREAGSGIELFILQFSDFGRPETLELFAREVMPQLREGVQAPPST